MRRTDAGHGALEGASNIYQKIFRLKSRLAGFGNSLVGLPPVVQQLFAPLPSLKTLTSFGGRPPHLEQADLSDFREQFVGVSSKITRFLTSMDNAVLAEVLAKRMAGEDASSELRQGESTAANIKTYLKSASQAWHTLWAHEIEPLFQQILFPIGASIQDYQDLVTNAVKQLDLLIGASMVMENICREMLPEVRDQQLYGTYVLAFKDALKAIRTQVNGICAMITSGRWTAVYLKRLPYPCSMASIPHIPTAASILTIESDPLDSTQNALLIERFKEFFEAQYFEFLDSFHKLFGWAPFVEWPSEPTAPLVLRHMRITHFFTCLQLMNARMTQFKYLFERLKGQAEPGKKLQEGLEKATNWIKRWDVMYSDTAMQCEAYLFSPADTPISEVEQGFVALKKLLNQEYQVVLAAINCGLSQAFSDENQAPPKTVPVMLSSGPKSPTMPADRQLPAKESEVKQSSATTNDR
ncbi:MAG: hypothetical protein V4490_04545 [Pseudomonadota bacterium]